MTVFDVLTSPWAISAEWLEAIQDIYFRHLRGEKADIAAIEARLGRPLVNQQDRAYEVRDGVAILLIEGVIARKMNMFSQISGGASTELASRDFKAAQADPDVRAIIQLLNTPGGTVDGTQEHARLVHSARGGKPIITLAQGTMASGGIWIGAAADEIYISSETDILGSIGVVATHTDISKAEEKAGIKTTEIYAGKFKRIASNHKPLSEAGEADIKARVDYLYSIFVQDIAVMRGVSPETVLEKMADGRLFIGRQAIDAGLADGFATLDEAITRALELADSQGRIFSAGGFAPRKEATMPGATDKPVVPTTAKEMAELYPEFAATIRQEGAESVNIEDIKKAATTAEKDRILGLVNIQFGAEPGAAFAAIVNTNVTVDQLTAIRAAAPIAAASAAGSDAQAQMLAAITSAGASNPGAGGKKETPAAGKTYETLVDEYKAVHKCTTGKAMQAIAAAHPDKHETWLAGKQLLQ